MTHGSSQKIKSFENLRDPVTRRAFGFHATSLNVSESSTKNAKDFCGTHVGTKVVQIDNEQVFDAGKTDVAHAVSGTQLN